MDFVLDASITACWAFDDEDHPLAATSLLRLQSDVAHVPGLWWYEVRNILVVNERRGRITTADTASFLQYLSHLGIMIHDDPQETAVLTLARTHRLTVYDASYLELTRRLAVPLATLDAQLMRAAGAEGLMLLDHD